MTPARIADLVFEAMETGQFYILADNPEDLGYVKMSGAVRYQVGDRRTHHLMGVLQEFLGPGSLTKNHWQAILEDSRSSIDGAVIGGGGLPRGDHVSEFMRNFRARPAEEEEAEQEEEEVAAE